jgi:hypothetical protein
MRSEIAPRVMQGIQRLTGHRGPDTARVPCAARAGQR